MIRRIKSNRRKNLECPLTRGAADWVLANNSPHGPTAPEHPPNIPFTEKSRHHDLYLLGWSIGRYREDNILPLPFQHFQALADAYLSGEPWNPAKVLEQFK